MITTGIHIRTCVCVCSSILVIYIYVYACMYVCVCTYVYMYECMHLCMYVPAYVCMYIHICTICMYVCVSIRVNAYIYIPVCWDFRYIPIYILKPQRAQLHQFSGAVKPNTQRYGMHSVPLIILSVRGTSLPCYFPLSLANECLKVWLSLFKTFTCRFYSIFSPCHEEVHSRYIDAFLTRFPLQQDAKLCVFPPPYFFVLQLLSSYL